MGRTLISRGKILALLLLLALLPANARDAGFTPGLPAAIPGITTGFGPGSGSDLRLSVTVDRGEGGAYRIGEELTVLVSVDRPVWLRLYHIQADGTARLIWPNDYVRNQWIPAGTDQRFPPADARYSFKVTTPLGRESILAFASTRPFEPGHPGLPDTGKPDRGSSVPRYITEPESWPPASASARAGFTVTR